MGSVKRERERIPGFYIVYIHTFYNSPCVVILRWLRSSLPKIPKPETPALCRPKHCKPYAYLFLVSFALIRVLAAFSKRIMELFQSSQTAIFALLLLFICASRCVMLSLAAGIRESEIPCFPSFIFSWNQMTDDRNPTSNRSPCSWPPPLARPAS